MGRLHSAARSGRYEEVVECLEQREDINAVGIRQMTPLMIAAQVGHLDIVKALLNAGAEIGIAPRHQRTALHMAACEGHLTVVQALVAYGADVNARTSGGYSPAMEAAQFNRVEVTTFLLAQGTDPTFQDKEGLTAADWLATGGIQGRSIREFPASLRNPPQAIALATKHVRQLMTEDLSADEYAAKNGRFILVWSYGFDPFEDTELRDWAQRVAEILFNSTLLEQCEERYLQGEALTDARKRRERRERWAKRHAKTDAPVLPMSDPSVE